MTSARGLVRFRWPIVLRDFLSSRSVGVVARVDAGDNRIFRRDDASGAGERHVGGSGESGTLPVERANDIHVIPQWGCATSTATRSLLHVPSSAPSTAGWSRSPGMGPALSERYARGWGAAGEGLGVLQVGGAFVQYAQPSTSRSRPSWSRSAQGGSLGADVVPMAFGSCAGLARVQKGAGFAARPCRLRSCRRQVSTALTLTSPTSKHPNRDRWNAAVSLRRSAPKRR